MARESVYNGLRVWRPDLIEAGHMLINPNEKPLDEAMRFCRTCVSIWLNKYGIWSERVEDIEDLESECVYRTYKQLIKRVVEGKYRKDLSFYLNCRSCAWSAISYALQLWREDIRRNNELSDIDDCVPGTTRKYSDVVTESVRWRTDADDVPMDQRGPAERPIESYKRQSAKAVAAKAHIDYWYELYQEMCIENCVEPMNKDQWVKDNIDQDIIDIVELDRIRKLPRPQLKKANAKAGRPRFAPTNDKKEAQRDYNRAYYRNHKETARLYAAEYRAQHREEIRIKQRKWYLKNKAKASCGSTFRQ